MRWLDGITDSVDMSLSKTVLKSQKTGEDRSLACCHSWGCQELNTTGHLNKVTYSKEGATDGGRQMAQVFHG